MQAVQDLESNVHTVMDSTLSISASVGPCIAISSVVIWTLKLGSARYNTGLASLPLTLAQTDMLLMQSAFEDAAVTLGSTEMSNSGVVDLLHKEHAISQS